MIEFRVVRCLHVEAHIARISARISADMEGKNQCIAVIEIVARLVAF